jgi:hypothetical protein
MSSKATELVTDVEDDPDMTRTVGVSGHLGPKSHRGFRTA